MNPDLIRDCTRAIRASCDAIDAELETVTPPEPPEPGDGVLVEAGGNLQAALDAGGHVTLAQGAAFFHGGGYTCTTPHTIVVGEGQNIVEGDTAPGLRIPPEIDDIAVETLTITSDTHAGLQVGRNDDGQVTLDQAPVGLRLRGVKSSGHRGKRTFEINAVDVEITDCEVYDCYSEAGQDSQAIWLGNCPGPVRVTGGYFEGGSENLMVGGDTMKIPNCRPTGITIIGATFVKPLSWKDAGVPKVKNLLELKDGHDVLIEDCDLSQCWKSAQDGYAFMFTPSQGGSLQNIVVRNCRVRDVGGIMNITGTDASAINPQRTQISLLGGEYRTNKTLMGGSGRFCLAGRGPEWIIVEDCTIEHEGSSFCDLADDKAPIDRLRIVNSSWNYGSYGIRIGGLNHGDNSQGIIGTVEITGNTITGAHSQFKSRYPDNTYVESMSQAREVEVDKRAKEYAHDLREELKRVASWEREYRL
jgi:hypothetical protein